MTKTNRAYYEVSFRKNLVRPDKYAMMYTPAPAENKEALPKQPEKRPQRPTRPPPPKSVEHSESDENEERYCICHRAWKSGELMFKCEGFCCNWYHPQCLGIHYTEIDKQEKSNERWYCPKCYERAYDIFLSCGINAK